MLRFACIPFDELTLWDLYDCMALRQEVFVVEQNCPYLDADGKDQDSWHLLGRSATGELAAYARLMPPGVSYPGYASMGRVVTRAAFRGKGQGRALMQEALRRLHTLFPEAAVKISAQTYLVHFYETLGFHPTGEEYLEDDIPHIAMIRPS